MLETAKVRPLVCRALVFKWHKRFRDGREDIEDDKGRGRKSTLTAASIKEVKDYNNKKNNNNNNNNNKNKIAFEKMLCHRMVQIS
jgi:hypothetical protein